ncbi:MAG TPA: exosortase-associated EpsI family protein [Opitutaceae bacterium]|nr:exosortase-associated EpsI family protein [Opitutaceae bacterium]
MQSITSDLRISPTATRLQHRRRFLLGTAIAVAAAWGAAWAAFPLASAKDRLQAVAARGPDFTSRDLGLNAAELTILGRVDLVHRVYALMNYEIYATIIDGTKDRHAVHDPRYCFQGAGWRILEERPLPIALGHANLIRAAQGTRRVDLLFWFSDGRTAHTSMTRYWWQTTLRRLTFGRSGPEPVLIVLQSHGAQQPEWPTFAAQVIERLRL